MCKSMCPSLILASKQNSPSLLSWCSVLLLIPQFQEENNDQIDNNLFSMFRSSFFLVFTYERNIAYLSFYIWLISFNMMASRSIHFSASDRFSFFMDEQHFVAYRYHIFFIHSSVDRHHSYCE
jgi:hypothetical protein